MQGKRAQEETENKKERQTIKTKLTVDYGKQEVFTSM
jgi:hypothetical protein